MQTNWYVATTKAGASRVAKDRVRRGELVQPDRRGENEVERSLRDAGFNCYFPRMRMEIVHHRTRKLIVKTFPLIAGYVFVQARECEFLPVTRCDYVGELLGTDGNPIPVTSEAKAIMQAETDLAFDETREGRKRRGQTIEDTWVGKTVEPALHGRVTSVTGRRTLMAMFTLFGRLTPVELRLDDVQLVA